MASRQKISYWRLSEKNWVVREVRGYIIEFTGEAIEALSMEGRMTLHAIWRAIEMGAKSGGLDLLLMRLHLLT